MTKRLLALLIAVICISITAVGSFAYSPNEQATLNKMYPDYTYFYGTVPSNGLGLPYIETYGFSETLTCPACGQTVIGLEVPISTYTVDDVIYINTEVMNGLYITGYYETVYAYTFGGRLIVGFNNDGDDREYGQNVDYCAETQLEDYLSTLDLMFVYDNDYGLERAFIYSHALPEGSYGVLTGPYVQVLCIPNIDKFGHTNPLFSTALNNYVNMTYDYNEIGEYYEYNNRVIRPVPFNTLYGNILNGGYDDGYNEGYQIGYYDGYNIGYDGGYDEGESFGYDAGYNSGYSEGEYVGYSNGYNIGLFDGQAVQEWFNDGFDNFMSDFFFSFEGFFIPFLSLGWGTLTVGAVLGFGLIVGLAVIIIKIIRG